MAAVRLNLIAGRVLVALSVAALIIVLVGFTQPPLPDEGALAHIWQLTVLATIPAFVVYALTVDPATPRRLFVRPLVLSGAALAGAAFALYGLEHWR